MIFTQAFERDLGVQMEHRASTGPLICIIQAQTTLSMQILLFALLICHAPTKRNELSFSGLTDGAVSINKGQEKLE